MKQNGIVYDTGEIRKKIKVYEEEGLDHLSASPDTPMKEGVFTLSDEEKILKIADHFEAIMDTLGLDLNDDSLKGTPLRVAKMYVNEIFAGLDPRNKPAMTLFDNKYGYREMVLEKDIQVHSYCEHHFVPIIGKAHVAYISSGQVIGLSKLNRIVRHFSKRPQVQERLTEQIGEELKKALNTNDVAVIIDASHLCVSMRGIEDNGSSTVTAFYSGEFEMADKKDELFNCINLGGKA